MVPLIIIGSDTANSSDAIRPAKVPPNNLTKPNITKIVSEPITAGNNIV